MTPLNTAQHGLWLGHTLNEDKALFNTAECIVFDGKVDADLLASAARQAVAESECLSCYYRSENEQPYRVATSEPVVFERVHLTASCEQDTEMATVRRWATQDMKQAFDLAHQLPCRFTLLHGEHQDYLYHCVHHIALDGFGTTLIFQRIAEIYSQLMEERAPTPSPFGSFQAVLDEDQQRRDSGAYDKARQFWLDTLAKNVAPSSYRHDIAPISAQFHRESCTFNDTLWQQCQSLAEHHQLTWVDLFLAALCTHLRHYSDNEQVVLGMMVMNRLGSKSLTVPCMQMNIVPLVVDVVADDDLLDVARKVAAHKKKMRRFQHYRYEDLRRDLNRVGGGQRLFGALVNIMPFDHPLHYGNVAASTLNLSAGPVEDLTIELHSKSEGVPEVDIDANPAVYDKGDLAELQQELMSLLTHWLASPTQTTSRVLASLHAQARQDAVISGETDARTHTPAESVLNQIRRHAAQQPDAIAVEQDGVVLTYESLVNKADTIASALRAQGVQSGERVGVALSRSLSCITTVLGVMFSGAVYVPLDPEQPIERQHLIVDQAAIRMLITEAQYQHSLSALPVTVQLAGRLHSEPVALPVVEAADPAYIMFTSGSTGQPKGVVVSHSAMNHFVAAAAKRYDIAAIDRVLQFAPFHFDASIEEIFVTLGQGATLVLRTDAMLESMASFSDAITAERVTVLDLPTAFWNEWVVSLRASTATLPNTLKGVIIGGEAVYPEPLVQWKTAVEEAGLTNRIRLFNTYGPTETTVVATCSELQDVDGRHGQLPIGLPLSGIDVLVLDDQLRPTTTGELVILGDTLADGYLGQAHPAFIRILVGGVERRAYRTGDRVTLIDGQLIYLGRIDNEFKISGYRIQPGEVESHLLALDGVEEACVQGMVFDNGLRRLVAFVAGKGCQNEDALAIKTALQSSLPPAMIPTDFRFFANLPKTLNNKIDRNALLASYEGDSVESVLASETESRVGAIWQQILGVSLIQSQDNFFELGGQSLQTIQIVNRLGAEFGVSIKVSDVFDRPVLNEFCRYLDEMQQQSEDEVEMVW
ncbi:non-ribosomal peptide synthetase [Salinivibrio sp. IB868]|uniref:non-ribosomal peptide synthetase n=1 Tax=unclassified Salinivibrio TaxID=2636825 RepID=UPI0009841E73|nr:MULTISPECIES: non-ribosomal peptide synthetase [unclassified Salinivibrio]OOE65510.1 non-ribosomal peptide synthetase [Salinivibrio sp. IB868]OOE72333.1 non-ribosomal peptide synthetase [Salinivibrio sp. IB870]